MRGTQFAELSAFVAVAEHRSFAKAATSLGISPATISQTIRTLEERLGVRLLNRTTRSVAPTEVGERLLSRLRPVLDDYKAALESVNAFRDRPAGHLRLTVAPPVASLVLGPLLANFSARFPDISVEVSVDATLTDIVAGRFDAGIRVGERLERDMVAIRLNQDLRAVVVASPDYLEKHGDPARPLDLQKHNCIRLRFPSGELQPWRFEMAGKQREVAVSGSLTVNDPDLAVRIAAAGAGIIYILEGYVADLLAKGQLIRIGKDWVPLDNDGFFLYYPTRKQNPAALQAFIDFVKTSPKQKRR